MTAKRWTDEQLIDAIDKCDCISDIFRYLGIMNNGSSFRYMKADIVRLKLDISHFYTKEALSRRSRNKITDLSPVFNGDKRMSSSSLRPKLFKLGYKEKICECCGLSEWMGKDIPLELHHINGNREDNRLENLQILCSNCHAQTDNHGSKNKAYRESILNLSQYRTKTSEKISAQKERKKRIKRENFCLTCGKRIRITSKYCMEHYNFTRRLVERPTKEELLELIEKNNYVKVGKMFGVSDNAIRKWLKAYSE